MRRSVASTSRMPSKAMGCPSGWRSLRFGLGNQPCCHILPIDPVLNELQGGEAKITSGRHGTASKTAATSPTSRVGIGIELGIDVDAEDLVPGLAEGVAPAVEAAEEVEDTQTVSTGLRLAPHAPVGSTAPARGASAGGR